MLPVEELLAYFPDDSVERPGTSELELDRHELPDHTRVFVLEPGKRVRKS